LWRAFANIQNSLEKDGDQRNTDDKQIQHIECRSTESPLMKDKPIGDHLQHQFNRKHTGEKVIEIVENLKRFMKKKIQ
jgi:hypothetical protein